MATREELTQAASANGFRGFGVNPSGSAGSGSAVSTGTSNGFGTGGFGTGGFGAGSFGGFGGFGKNSTRSSSGVATPSDRANAIGKMYDNNVEAQKADLRAAYDKNMSEAQAQKENIAQNYDQAKNELSAQYEKNRRNNNIQASNNGLNTGAASQMQLGQSNAYLSNFSKLGASEATQQAEADRNIANLKINLQNDMAKAVASGEYQKAAAMLDEYNTQYTRAQTEAQALAQYGDFSGWAKIVGSAEAAKMQQAWALQNPDLAITQGLITEDQYFDMTGKHSNNYTRLNQGIADATGGGGGMDPGTYNAIMGYSVPGSTLAGVAAGGSLPASWTHQSDT